MHAKRTESSLTKAYIEYHILRSSSRLLLEADVHLQLERSGDILLMLVAGLLPFVEL